MDNDLFDKIMDLYLTFRRRGDVNIKHNVGDNVCSDDSATNEDSEPIERESDAREQE